MILKEGQVDGSVSMAVSAFAARESWRLAHPTTADHKSERVGVNPGELGEHPMPGPQGRGRAIPSQAGTSPGVPGVCNEQVPGAKAKVCSEPYGNVGSAAEMPAPLVVRA